MNKKKMVMDKTTYKADVGDLVKCCNCGKLMLINVGEDNCPNCNTLGNLIWADDKQEYSWSKLKENGYVIS